MQHADRVGTPALEQPDEVSLLSQLLAPQASEFVAGLFFCYKVRRFGGWKVRWAEFASDTSLTWKEKRRRPQ